MAVSDRTQLHQLVDELTEGPVTPANDALSRLRSPEEAEDWSLAQVVGPDLDAADREIASGTARAIPWADVQAALHAPDPDAALDALTPTLHGGATGGQVPK